MINQHLDAPPSLQGCFIQQERSRVANLNMFVTPKTKASVKVLRKQLSRRKQRSCLTLKLCL
jgi:hypothetical protein